MPRNEQASWREEVIEISSSSDEDRSCEPVRGSPIGRTSSDSKRRSRRPTASPSAATSARAISAYRSRYPHERELRETDLVLAAASVAPLPAGVSPHGACSCPLITAAPPYVHRARPFYEPAASSSRVRIDATWEAIAAHAGAVYDAAWPRAFASLHGQQWLNDYAVNAIMKDLCAPFAPHVHYLSSYFLPSVASTFRRRSTLSRDTPPSPLSSSRPTPDVAKTKTETTNARKRRALLAWTEDPSVTHGVTALHYSGHWILVVCDKATRAVVYFDSMPGYRGHDPRTRDALLREIAVTVFSQRGDDGTGGGGGGCETDSQRWSGGTGDDAHTVGSSPGVGAAALRPTFGQTDTTEVTPPSSPRSLLQTNYRLVDGSCLYQGHDTQNCGVFVLKHLALILGLPWDRVDRAWIARRLAALLYGQLHISGSESGSRESLI